MIIDCIPESEIQIAMTRGVLDMLTVIDQELVSHQSIRWVKRTIRARCGAADVGYTHAQNGRCTGETSELHCLNATKLRHGIFKREPIPLSKGSTKS